MGGRERKRGGKRASEREKERERGVGDVSCQQPAGACMQLQTRAQGHWHACTFPYIHSCTHTHRVLAARMVGHDGRPMSMNYFLGHEPLFLFTADCSTDGGGLRGARGRGRAAQCGGQLRRRTTFPSGWALPGRDARRLPQRLRASRAGSVGRRRRCPGPRAAQ